MGELVAFPEHRIVREATRSKREIAMWLGRSTRWVEIQMREHGLPYERDRSGRARFYPSKVRAWQEERSAS